jgi:Fe-S-cluster containining protein
MIMELEQITLSEYCLNCRGCCRFNQKEGPWLPQLLNGEKTEHGTLELVACDSSQGCAYRCSFLDLSGNVCAIYASRPFECRLYPFVLNRRGGRFFLSVDLNCPYAGERSQSAEFIAYAGRLVELLRTPEWREALKQNMNIFQPYSEVKDIAEIEL